MDKKNIQEKDLKNVSGGIVKYESAYCTCQGCRNRFRLDDAEDKYVNAGCMDRGDRYFKCPVCGTWVDRNGDVEK